MAARSDGSSELVGRSSDTKLFGEAVDAEFAMAAAPLLQQLAGEGCPPWAATFLALTAQVATSELKSDRTASVETRGHASCGAETRGRARRPLIPLDGVTNRTVVAASRSPGRRVAAWRAVRAWSRARRARRVRDHARTARHAATRRPGLLDAATTVLFATPSSGSSRRVWLGTARRQPGS